VARCAGVKIPARRAWARAGRPGSGAAWRGGLRDLAAVRPGCWWLPADAGSPLGREPVCKSGAGALTHGSRTVASSTPVRLSVPDRAPGHPRTCPDGEARERVLAMMAPQEVEDEEYEQVLERVAAAGVARATGMVCTRVPHPARPGKRQTRVWEVDAATGPVMELAGHLAAERIEKVTLESTSDYWRIWFCLLEAAGLDVQLVNARDVKNAPGRPKTDPLTELRAEVPQVSGRIGSGVATFPGHDRRWRGAAGSVWAGGAAARVA
jgi:hypothetical protein